MLNFIIGRMRTGKSAYLENIIKTTVSEGKSGVMLIVPEQSSFSAERSMLSLLGPRDADKIEILSFTRLAENVLYGPGREKRTGLDDGGRAVIMSLALESVAEKLEIYKSHSRSISVVGELLKLSDELKSCGVAPNELLKAAGTLDDCLLKSKLQEISLIAETYDTLTALSFDDDRNLLTELYDHLSENNYFKGKTVAFDAFDGFTAQEQKVIEKIMKQADETYITLCTDCIYEKEEGGDAFGHVRETSSSLIAAAKKTGVPVSVPFVAEDDGRGRNSSALRFLERELYSSEQNVFMGDASDITVCAARDKYEECAYVASEIKKLLRSGEYRCRDIAVIERNAGDYDDDLRSAFEKCGIPVFEDKRQPIITQPLIVFVRAAIETASRGFSCDRVLRFLKTGLTDIGEEEISELENYALMWNIGGDRWLSDWKGNPRGFGEDMTADDIEKLAVINDIRKRAVLPLNKLREAFKDSSGSEKSRAVYEMLRENDVTSRLGELARALFDSGEQMLALEQGRMWDMLIGILDMTDKILEDVPVSPERYREIFDIIISTKSLGNIPQGLDEIAVGNADRMITSSPKAVFVVGANDGVFPKNPVMKGILSDNDRKTLREIGLTLYDSGESRVMAERFLVYKTLCCVSDKLFISYSATSGSGAAIGQSEFVSQIKRMFPSCVRKDTVLMFETELPEGLEPAFEQACLNRRDGGELYETLRSWFEDNGLYGGRFDALERAASDKDFSIDDKKIAEKLFGRTMRISASRIESYYKCPFAYFCKYGIMAKPRVRAEFDPSIQGTEIHFVLETILRKYGKDGLLSMSYNDIRENVKKILDEFLIDKLGGEEDKTKRFKYLYERLVKTISEIVSRLAAEFKECSFVPVDFELKIASDGDIRPYEVTGRDGKKVIASGFIDRVDKLTVDDKTYIRVIDYKSGIKNFDLSDVFDGLNMQMLIYLFAIWENGEERYGEVTPAGVLYMPVRAPVQKVERSDSDDKKVKEALKKFKMSGIVLDDTFVIMAMDPSGKGIFIPAEIDKTGKAAKSVISLKQLKRLKDKTDDIMLKMAESLGNGKIEAVPVRGKNYDKTCDYCDYRGVCGFENGSRTRKLSDMNYGDCLEILDGEADGNVDA
ncbi:MAG: PD-(D/E)XK nuclease family protein [Clostridiales bacterium]|nr:PD-(D/E)XK nuclease family protein [Clostridiales bacterium]